MEATTDPRPPGEATMAVAAAPFDAGLVAVAPSEGPFILGARARSWPERGGGRGKGGESQLHPSPSCDLRFDP